MNNIDTALTRIEVAAQVARGIVRDAQAGAIIRPHHIAPRVDDYIDDAPHDFTMNDRAVIGMMVIRHPAVRNSIRA
jgi:hypothetical protein